LGERLLCKQEVIGSIPFTSTNDFARAKSYFREFIDKSAFIYEFFEEEFIGCCSLTIRKK
jgi:hypothetical protein